ncbi:MAG: ComEC family competence protein [Cyclobacteriaceae bacterium]
MFKWAPFPFIRFCLILIGGIIFYDQFWIEHWGNPIIFCGVLMGCYLVLILGRIRRVLVGIVGVCLIFMMGVGLAYYKCDLNDGQHYTHVSGKVSAFSGEITSDYLEKDKYFRFEVTLDRVLVEKEQSVRGKIHLYIKKPVTFLPEYGDHILVSSSFSPIPEPLNPGEFNYREYISKSQIYGQCFVTTDQVAIEINDKFSLMNLAIDLRRKSIARLRQLITSERESSIAIALILGVKDYLDNDIKTAYSSAGAMHVLAVSGLHVGIVFLMINGLFRAFGSSKLLMTIRCCFLIISVWSFALLTGLSPSVTRAATMFSVLAVKDVLGERTNIYNSLGFAAFIILIFEPYHIYSVGFQLSFIAVFGIVYFYPLIYQLFSISNYLGDLIWSITCISIAAQLATFPLTSYYFHQFPTYFMISNLAVIPGAYVVLISGLMLLVFGWFAPLVKIFAWITGGAIYLLNEGVMLVKDIPNSLISWLYLDQMEVVLIYLTIIFLFTGINYRSFVVLSMSAVCLIGTTSSIQARYLQSNDQFQILIYEIKGKTAIDVVEGRNAHLFVSDLQEHEMELLKYQIDPYRLLAGLPSIGGTLSDMKSLLEDDPITLFNWRGKRFGILNGGEFKRSFKQPLNLDFLIISKRTDDLMKWLEQMNTQEIIFTSGCNNWWIRKMMFELNDNPIRVHCIPFHGFWKLAIVEGDLSHGKRTAGNQRANRVHNPQSGQ